VTGVPRGGLPTGLCSSMQTCRIHRARLHAQVADVAAFCPLAAGRLDRTYRHARPRLEMRYSHLPDAISPYHVRRIEWCTRSKICYKLMLDSDMLEKSAILKKFARK
jgi:hypothetical protein